MALTKFNIVGPSYVYRSKSFDCQRSVNLYPVSSEVQNNKAPTAMVGCPGLKTFATLPNYPHRAAYATQGRAFAVAGYGFYEITAAGGFNLLGNLLTDSGYVSIADNGTQLCIVDGDNGYILTLVDNTFAQINSEGFKGANTVAFADGYFVFNDPGTGQYYISSLNDGSQEDPLDFATAEGSPDNLAGLIAVHRDVWLLGENTIEVAFDSGQADFPFSRINGVFIEYGCAAVGSIAKSANTLFWLGKDNQGLGTIWMANGYQPQRISTYALEYAFQQYSTLADAIAYTYQEDGHYFYVLNFSSANTTWVYDINMQQWHERAYFNNGQFERHRGQTHMFAFGMHLIGDYQDGRLYQQSLNLYDDDGQTRVWLRTAPHITDAAEYIYYDSFQLDMEVGTGLNDGGVQDTNPQVSLQWSNDGGYTWSNEHFRDVGKIGAYLTRTIWRRLGRSRDRVFKLIGATRTKTFIIRGITDASAGDN